MGREREKERKKLILEIWFNLESLKRKIDRDRRRIMVISFKKRGYSEAIQVNLKINLYTVRRWLDFEKNGKPGV